MVGYSNFSIFGGGKRLLAPLGWRRDGGLIGRGGGRYDPNQPRVPRGHPDGGQWTDDGRGEGDQSEGPLRLASKDPPERLPARRGPNLPTPRPPRGGGGGWLGLFIRLGLQAIADYLEKNRRPDLVGGGSENVKKSGRPGDGKSTIAVTSIDGEVVYGTNSTYHKYSAEDEARATRMRDTLIKKHPIVMSTRNIGRFPNNGLFHAEATLLLRAASDRGGTLAGRTLEIVVNNEMCESCQLVLPVLALELGNPTLFFTDLDGRRFLIRDGQIKEVMR